MSNILARLRQQVHHLVNNSITPTPPPLQILARPARSFSAMSVRSNPFSLVSIGVLFLSAVVVLWLNHSTQDTRAATITDWVKPGDKSGEFKRQQSSFRSWISKDPNSEFPAEKGRYHLYVSYACPWGTTMKSSAVLLKPKTKSSVQCC